MIKAIGIVAITIGVAFILAVVIACCRAAAEEDERRGRK